MTAREAAVEMLAGVLDAIGRAGRPHDANELARLTLDSLLKGAGAVIPDPALLDAVREADGHECDCNCSAGECPSRYAREALADSILAQLEPWR